MIPTLTDLENDIINAIADCELGKFYTSLEYDDEDGNNLVCDIDGWIDYEDGDVSINECAVSYYDADDNELPFEEPNVCYIEKEATSCIREALQEARNIEETEAYLSWGGWFV